MKTPQVIAALAVLGVMLRLWRRRRARSTGAARRSAPARSLPRVPLGDVGLVARREVRERVRGRIFQVGTVIMLLVVAAAIVIPVLTKTTPRPVRVGVVGELSTPLRTVLDATAKSLSTTVTVATETDQKTARAALRAGQVDLVVAEGQLLVNKPIADTDSSARAQFVRAASRTLGAVEAYQAAKLSATQADVLARARPVKVTSLQAPSASGTVRTTSVVALVLVFIMLSQYNTWTLTGIVEEKASRVVEVLLAAIRPIQLLSGKVLGIGIVAFAQATLIVTVALGLAEAVGSDLLQGTAPMTLVSTLVWLVLGYAFYCWVYAAAGSTAARLEQVQSLAFPLTLPLILGYVVSLSAAGSGNAGIFIRVLSFLPPTAPFAMPVLVGLGKTTWWQFAASAAISLAGTVLVARLASTVYRRAILRTGRRVGIREALFAKAAGPKSR
jgi:ABC-2 type transport system permease protein